MIEILLNNMSMLNKTQLEYFEIMSKIVTKLSNEVGMHEQDICDMLELTKEEVEELNMKKGSIN